MDNKPANDNKPKTDPLIEEHEANMRSARNMKRGQAVAALCITVILAIAFTTFINDRTDPATAPVVEAASANLSTVTITNNGFVPQTLTIKKGTVVVWQSAQIGQPVIIASNPYPQNNSLPSLKSQQLNVGASYRYKFDQEGTVSYHDDLNPNTNGFIIVK